MPKTLYPTHMHTGMRIQRHSDLTLSTTGNIADKFDVLKIPESRRFRRKIKEGTGSQTRTVKLCSYVCNAEAL